IRGNGKDHAGRGRRRHRRRLIAKPSARADRRRRPVHGSPAAMAARLLLARHGVSERRAVTAGGAIIAASGRPASLGGGDNRKTNYAKRVNHTIRQAEPLRIGVYSFGRLHRSARPALLTGSIVLRGGRPDW